MSNYSEDSWRWLPIVIIVFGLMFVGGFVGFHINDKPPEIMHGVACYTNPNPQGVPTDTVWLCWRVRP